MTTVEDRRRFYAASLLLGLALSAVANGDDSPDTAEERERARTRRGGLLDEGSRLLDAIGC